jgi:arylsulfatase A-like enzyme
MIQMEGISSYQSLSKSDRMNVLLVTADQWRGDTLGCLGHACARTPNLDALAADATIFLRHFSNATPCGPARACLHTGAYAFNHRSVRNGTPLDSTLTTLALEARRAGYDPTLFGYTDTSADPRVLAADDPRLLTYEGILPGYRTGLLLTEDGAPWLDHLAKRGYGRLSLEEAYEGPLGAPARWRHDDSETAFLTDAFVAWLETQRPRSGWFSHLSYIKPHPPLVAAAPWHALVAPSATPAPVRAATLEEEARLHPWLAAWLDLPFSGHGAGMAARPSALDADLTARLRAIYYGLVAEVDHHLGRVIATLARRGELDHTLIVVTADHGEMLGDHWMLGKAGFFPAAYHVPLLVRWPGSMPGHGRRVAAFTEHVDLMPTILEAIGAALPKQCDGLSLSEFVTGTSSGPAHAWREAAHAEHDFRDMGPAVVEGRLGLAPEAASLQVRLGGRWAYVHFAALPPILIDTVADPGWRRNLADESAHASAALEEARALLSLRMRRADRRLSGCLLTPGGMEGAYDPLPAGFHPLASLPG